MCLNDECYVSMFYICLAVPNQVLPLLHTLLSESSFLRSCWNVYCPPLWIHSLPQATDETMLDKLKQNHQDNPFISLSSYRRPSFAIQHFAGRVTYDIKVEYYCPAKLCCLKTSMVTKWMNKAAQQVLSSNRTVFAVFSVFDFMYFLFVLHQNTRDFQSQTFSM